MAQHVRRVVWFLTALTVASVWSTPPARAWDPQTRIRIVDEAVRFMPLSLRLALERHRDPLMRGMLVSLTEAPPEALAPPWQGGTLQAGLDRSARQLGSGLKEGVPFSEVARRFGHLALYVTEAGFPPAMAQDLATERRTHFSSFCEDRRPKFPLVFYGHDDEALTGGDYAGFATEVMEWAAQQDANLARAYRLAGSPPDPSHFGDRSIPFAVGSLAYSRSVTHLVRAWLTVWQRAGGDMGATPYMPETTAPRETDQARDDKPVDPPTR